MADPHADPEPELLQLLRADDPDLSGRRLGSYDLLQVLAAGGQGVVVRARHRLLDADQALKILDPSAGAASAERFLQEGRVLSRLRHANLPRVTELGHDEGVSWLAMELIEGEDLEERLEGEGIPPFLWSAQALAPVARALQYCHEAGVVHRDVKPANIVIEEGSQRPVLVDFGLLKRDPDHSGLGSLETLVHSRSEAIKGTPEFMAPEQADPGGDHDVGPAADVYALGVTLFQLLCGSPPFEGDSTRAVLRDVVERPAPSPRRLNPDVPPHLDRLCRRALDKSPLRRPTAAEFAAALLGEGDDLEDDELEDDEPQEHEGSDDLGASARRRLRLRRGGARALRGAVDLDSSSEVDSYRASSEQRRALPAEPPPELPWSWVVGLGGLSLVCCALAVGGALGVDAALLVLAGGGLLGLAGLTLAFVARARGVAIARPRRPALPRPRLPRRLPFRRRPPEPPRPAPSPAEVPSSSAAEAPIQVISASSSASAAESSEEALASQQDAAAGDPRALAERGLLRLRQRDYAGAAADFREVLRLRPDDLEAQLSLGVARLKQGRLPEARRAFDGVLAARPDDPEALEGRGAARFKQGDWEGAAEDLGALVRLRPQDAEARANLGAACYRRGDLEAARDQLDRALELDPESVEAYRRRGRVRFKQRDFAGAIADWDQVLRRRPDDEDARRKRKVARARARG